MEVRTWVFFLFFLFQLIHLDVKLWCFTKFLLLLLLLFFFINLFGWKYCSFCGESKLFWKYFIIAHIQTKKIKKGQSNENNWICGIFSSCNQIFIIDFANICLFDNLFGWAKILQFCLYVYLILLNMRFYKYLFYCVEILLMFWNLK